MGVRLLVEILDHRPQGMKPGHVLALLSVAERASDTTRLGWPGRAEVAHRMDSTEKTATRALASLVESGLLVVKRTGGGRGKPTVYFVPPLIRDTLTVPVSDKKPGHSEVETGTSGDLNRDSRTLKPPITLIEPSENPHHHSRAAATIAGLGATEEEIQRVLKKIRSERSPRNLSAYVSKLAETGDLAEWLNQTRTDAAASVTDEAYRRGWSCKRCRTRNRTGTNQCRQCGHDPAGEP